MVGVVRWDLPEQSCPCLVVVSGLEDNDPDEEAARDEREDGGGDLEVPRPRQVVVEGVCATQPEVLALQTEGVVREDHHGHHDEHSCSRQHGGFRLGGYLLMRLWGRVGERGVLCVGGGVFVFVFVCVCVRVRVRVRVRMRVCVCVVCVCVCVYVCV